VTQPQRYVLVTPARDESATIGAAIAAVRAQAVPPARWVIVDDGSTDGTAATVRAHAAGADWIRLVRREPDGRADFASKVAAFRAGVDGLGDVSYDLIGNLDADIEVPPDYFARVLRAFAERPRLGIAGGHLIEEYHGRRVPQRISANSVSGAVQLFRREAFEAIGGLRPMPLGGEDTVAEVLARMHGWEVATLFEVEVRHHGQVLSLHSGALTAWFTRGMVNRSVGYDPVFQAAVSGYRALVQSPYLLCGAAMLAGYLTAALRRVPPALEPTAIGYLRAEQRRRLRRGLTPRAGTR
jgi:biofilm PGA synthesis N-glycosyltransferase PgaC